MFTLIKENLQFEISTTSCVLKIWLPYGTSAKTFLLYSV